MKLSSQILLTTLTAPFLFQEVTAWENRKLYNSILGSEVPRNVVERLKDAGIHVPEVDVEYPLHFKVGEFILHDGEKPIQSVDQNDIKRKFSQFSQKKFAEERDIRNKESIDKLLDSTYKYLPSDHSLYLTPVTVKVPEDKKKELQEKFYRIESCNSQLTAQDTTATDFRGRPKPTKTPEQEKNWNKIKPQADHQNSFNNQFLI